MFSFTNYHLIGVIMILFLSYSCESSLDGTPVAEEGSKSQSTTKTQIDIDNTFIEIDLLDLIETGKMPPALEIEIATDHVFNEVKNYIAYPLRETLKPYLDELGVGEDSDGLVTFTCSDGYQPTQKISELMSAEGFLAFQDLALKDTGKSWPDSVSEKFVPLYLVWKNIPYDETTLGWPYGLIKIKIEKANTLYDPITPHSEPTAMKGFELYKKHCIKCHSINKIGGNLGPEMNYPKNITEYWPKTNIIAFVKNPQSFRYNAKMPAIDYLEEEDYLEILNYLEFAKQIKLETFER